MHYYRNRGKDEQQERKKRGPSNSAEYQLQSSPRGIGYPNNTTKAASKMRGTSPFVKQGDGEITIDLERLNTYTHKNAARLELQKMLMSKKAA